MARIIILGGGRQGRIIANDLSGDHDVAVADLAAVNLPGIRNLQRDLSRPLELVGTLQEYDVIVGALPARLGFAAAQAAVKAKRHYVDLSYYIEDAAQLHGAAQAAGMAIMPDCGLAPGLSNLIAGRALATRRPEEINIQVGGFAADPKKPYGYVITWSPEGLLDEYLRPARIIRDGKVVEVPALSGLEIIKIAGIGDVEAFFTDGLRTLLAEADPPGGVPRIKNMTEKTMRWPGHVEAVKPLIASGTLVDELTEKCREGADMVVFRLQVDGDVVTMVDRARDGMSAMARTTALTCAAFTRWVAAARCSSPAWYRRRSSQRITRPTSSSWTRCACGASPLIRDTRSCDRSNAGSSGGGYPKSSFWAILTLPGPNSHGLTLDRCARVIQHACCLGKSQFCHA